LCWIALDRACGLHAGADGERHGDATARTLDTVTIFTI